MAAVDENRSLLGLLNGLVRHDYYDDKEITMSFLKSELYPDAEETHFEVIVSKARTFIKNMARSDMDLHQAEMFLVSQAKKKDSGLLENQVQIYLKFWKTHKKRIYECLVQRSMWSNKLKNLSWRIDVQSRSKNSEMLNTPSAIVELQIENPAKKKEDVDVLQFEMDEGRMNTVLSQLKDIEELIKVHTKQN